MTFLPGCIYYAYYLNIAARHFKPYSTITENAYAYAYIYLTYSLTLLVGIPGVTWG
jgi:hypothetical protein